MSSSVCQKVRETLALLERRTPTLMITDIVMPAESVAPWGARVTKTPDDNSGLVQTASENKRVIAAFLRELGEGAGVQVQRCQWHKRENVVSYLAKQDQPVWRRKLQVAHERPEVTVVRGGTVGDGTAVSPREGPSPSSLAQAGAVRQTFTHELRRGVSRIIGGII